MDLDQTSQWLKTVQRLAAEDTGPDAAFKVVADLILQELGDGICLWMEEGSQGFTRALVRGVHPRQGERAVGRPLAGALAPQIGALIGSGSMQLQRGQLLLDPPAAGDGRQTFTQVLTLPLYTCDERPGAIVYFSSSAIDKGVAVLTQLGLLANVFASQAASRRYAGRLLESNRRMQDEFEKVAEIQQALLPGRFVQIPGVEYATSFRAFGHAGGDYYDIMALPRHGGRFEPGEPLERLGLMVADAAGHGVSAAVEVAMLDAILRTYSGPSSGPGAVLAYANRHLFTRRIRGTFLTAFAANYDAATRQLIYASAGHNPPLLRRENAAAGVAPLEMGEDIPLLVLRDQQWRDQQIQVEPGDLVVVYTDGITETVNRSGEEFGQGRLQKVVSNARPAAKSVVTAIEMALDDFRDGVHPRDDQTLVVLRFP